MSKVVIDTNVLLVANSLHQDVSSDCIAECIKRLTTIQESGVIVIDDEYRILGEYGNKTKVTPPKGVGDVFLKWLLRQAGNPKFVEVVSLTETEKDCFVEFPDSQLEPLFDAPDRKFVAVAHAHTDRPTILQAADCKWLDWWPSLAQHGIQVDFICPDDACRFYKRKFPHKQFPLLPGEQ